MNDRTGYDTRIGFIYSVEGCMQFVRIIRQEPGLEIPVKITVWGPTG